MKSISLPNLPILPNRETPNRKVYFRAMILIARKNGKCR